MTEQQQYDMMVCRYEYHTQEAIEEREPTPCSKPYKKDKQGNTVYVTAVGQKLQQLSKEGILKPIL